MEKVWYRKQLRILQTVLREKDLLHYDTDAVVAYMNEMEANCLVVNAGGVIDFFPNTMELGRPNRYLSEQDILAELTEKCHASHIHVIARVDFRGVEKERYERRPDWFGKNEDGSPLMGWNDTIYRPCYTGYYGNEYAQEYVRRLLATYDLDGIWENCVIFGYGPCYCQSCKKQYKEDTGLEIPVGEDYYSEKFRTYRDWKSKYAKMHMKKMKDIVKSFSEEKVYVSEIFGMYHASVARSSGIDLYDAKDNFDFLVSPAFLDGCAQEDKKYDNYDYGASCVRFLSSIAPEKQCVALTGGNGTKWRYVIAPKQESRIWMWEILSAGGNLWNNYFNGICPGKAVDRRNAGIEKEFFQYMKENEEWITDQVSCGKVGIFYSRETRDMFCSNNENEDEYGVFIKGVERVLEEHHIACSFIPNLDFSYDKIKDLNVLLLPNAVCMSEEEMDAVRRYVMDGGGLVASYMTSLYDAQGQKRSDFGLKDILGCSYTGIVKDTQYDSYQKVRAEHPVLKDMEIEHTEMIINEGMTLLCNKVNDQYETICTYVPRIYNQPPECAWIPEEQTDYSTITAGTFGKGRVVYFANQTEKTCYTNGHEDLIHTYFNAVDWVKREPFELTSDAPDSVRIHMTCDRVHPDKKVISFVNTTAGQYRPVRSLQPVYDFTVRLENAKLSNYRILRQEGDIRIVQESDAAGPFIRISISKLQEFSAVYLETEA